MGDAIDYLITARSIGADPASNIVISWAVPEGTQLAAIRETHGVTLTSDSTHLTATANLLLPGQEVSFTVRVQAQVAGTVEARASVAIAEEDINPADNTSIAQTLVNAVSNADLVAEFTTVRLTGGGTDRRGRRRPERLVANIKVINAGSQASESATLLINISSDGTFDGSDALLRTLRVPRLRPGNSRLLRLFLRPGGTESLAGKYLFARIDPVQEVPENNKANNTSMTLIQPAP